VTPSITVTLTRTLTPTPTPTVSGGADDNASNSAYNDGLQNGDNGGTGFSAWSITNVNNAGQYIETSSNPCAGDPDPWDRPVFGDIRVDGKTWAGYANPNANNYFDLYRKAINDLAVGYSLSARVAAAFRSGNKGIELINNSNTTLFNFNIGSDKYTVDGVDQTSWGYNESSVFVLSGRQIGSNTYNALVQRGTDAYASLNRTGVLRGFHIYMSNTNANCGDNYYFNDMKVYYTG